MKKSLMVLGLSFIASTSIFAQQNPACSNPQLNPNPLANVGSQFDLTYQVGNSGTMDIDGSSEMQRMKFSISMGKCKPSVGSVISIIGTNALTGDALNFFDVTYDVALNTFYGTQKTNVSMGMVPMGMHTITIHAQVTLAASTNTIGGSMNVQPNPASSGTQVASDDAIAIYTATTGSPLPVVLDRFEANASGCAVGLNWNTGAEQNFDHFEIERGQDRSFSQIGTVKAKGDNSAYAFTDAKPVNGLNTYRLKLVDADGSFIYSAIAAAKANCPVVAAEISVYPNPAQSAVNVKGLTAGSTLRLMDVTGRMVVEKTNSAAAETLDMSKLPSAIYTLLVIENGALKTTVKVSKQ